MVTAARKCGLRGRAEEHEREGATGIVPDTVSRRPAAVDRRVRSGGAQDRRRPALRERGGAYPRSVAPVAFTTAATTFAATASISASVSVRSFGCSVTSMASDLRPASIRSPS